MLYRAGICLLISLFLKVSVFAQPTAPSAEAAALGGAFATQSSVFSSRHNVAGLAFLEKNAVAAGLRNNYLANNLNDFYLLSAFKVGRGRLGIDFLYYGFEAYQQNEIGLSYALQLNENWSFGTRLHYANNQIPQESVSRYLISGDLGILGKNKNWRFGAAVQNIIQSKWQGRISEAEPTIFHVGAGYYFNENAALRAEFYKASNAAADLRLGVNYKVVEQLDIRFGFATLQPAVSFGLGIFVKNFQINLAATWHQQLGLSPVTDFVYEW